MLKDALLTTGMLDEAGVPGEETGTTLDAAVASVKRGFGVAFPVLVLCKGRALGMDRVSGVFVLSDGQAFGVECADKAGEVSVLPEERVSGVDRVRDSEMLVLLEGRVSVRVCNTEPVKTVNRMFDA